MTDSVVLEKRGQAFWITINRPEKRNAINGDVIAGIAKGYRDAHADVGVRAIVLTGAGDKAFCAGADLLNSGAAFAMDFARPNVDYADLLRLSQNATKPAIARVGGVCMAGGMGPALHDRHGGGGRPRDVRTARGQGRRFPDAGAEPAAIDRAAPPDQ
jgi:methylglutaconyl-CoA hydratase